MLSFYIQYIVPFSVLIPLFVGFRNYQILVPAFRIILWFVLFSAIVNGIVIALSHQGVHTSFIFHIYTVFEFLFLSLFYLQVFGKDTRKIIIPLIALFSLWCIYNYLFLQNGDKVNTYTRPIEAIIVMLYGMLFINKQNNVERDASWGSDGLNWINTGILIYYASNLFVFVFFNFLVNGERYMFEIAMSLHDTLMIAEYVLFAIGFYKCRAKTKSSLPVA